jgi:UMF1 family MFS transporter
MGRALTSRSSGLQSPRRREVFGYCMFDFANSSYTTLINTVAFAVYFRQVVVGTADGRGDLLWSVAHASANVLLILLAPVLGALADYSGRKKRFLLSTTLLTVSACALLYLVEPGDVLLGMLLCIFGTLGFESSYIFYNAFLPEVSTPRTIGRISGWSWGAGFIGGLVALAACLPLLRTPLLDPLTGSLDPGSTANYRLSFLVVAAFFALFAMPTFMFLRESGRARRLRSWQTLARAGFRRVGETLLHLRRYRETAKYFVAALFFYGGIETVIKFSAIYASVTFGIQGLELLYLFIFANIIAAPGTMLFGYVADWIGGKRALVLLLAIWIGLLFLGATAGSKQVFWLMTVGVAIGVGGTQAVGRSFMSQISPASRKSEFFGFYLLCSKAGSIIGVLLFGLVSALTGSQRAAVLAVLPFFAFALLLMLILDERKAVEIASSQP